MILAEKITALRKKNGWSQEELAMQLNVSRQSVSKWESAASIPDLDRILQLSRLFGVTTDYLLKDDAEELAALTFIRKSRSGAFPLTKQTPFSEKPGFPPGGSLLGSPCAFFRPSPSSCCPGWRSTFRVC